MSGVELIKYAAELGVLGLLGLYFIQKFFSLLEIRSSEYVQAQDRQSEAGMKQVVALERQADSLDRVEKSVSGFVLRENRDHEQIKIGVQVLTDEVRDLGELIRQGKTDSPVVRSVR